MQGRPIEAVRFGSGAQRILVIGSVHGDEPEGVELAQRLANHLRRNHTALAGRTVMIVRDANPDGHRARSRTNARGVDLNRNFPARNWERLSDNGRMTSGARPASEPETQTLLKLLHRFQPHRIVAIHSTRGAPLVNYDGPAQILAQAMSRGNGYEVSGDIGYPTPGSLGSYLGRDGRIPIITLELPRGINPEQAWEENRAALLEAIRFSPSSSPAFPVRRGGIPQARLSREQPT